MWKSSHGSPFFRAVPIGWRIFLSIVSGLFVGGGLAGSLPWARATQSQLDFFSGAEERFTAPPMSWFEDTQDHLRDEMRRVGAALDAQGAEYAQGWKNHFRWNLLEQNLRPLAEINLAEIELSRRWMYSNRKGTEYPFFKQLRESTDAYLDAAYTLSQPDLKAQFVAQVKLARLQLEQLQQAPTDANAAALGKTLGWLERTGQLPVEVAAVRRALSVPNLQVVVSEALVLRLMAAHDSHIDQRVPVADKAETAPKRRFQQPRTVHVRGTARTAGQVTLSLKPNPQVAELSVLYRGIVDSVCRGQSGPLAFTMVTAGPVSATTPVTFGPQGIEAGSTTVTPEVHTRVTSISAESNFVRRVGTRRLKEPDSQARMSGRARSKTSDLLQQQMDSRVAEAVTEIQQEISRSRSNAGKFAEVIAPLYREGAAPYFHGTASTREAVTTNVYAQRRDQFGAATRCPIVLPGSDVQIQLHVSFLSNMLATIMGGKTFTDEYFAKYAKVLQPTLPLDLMVHSRARRWAIIAAKERPFELSIPTPHQLKFVLQLTALELDGQRYVAPIRVTVGYELTTNEIEEYYLQRTGELELQSDLTADQQAFLQKKLAAFFSPVLDASGVVIPEGGAVGALNLLHLTGVQAEQDWLAVGWEVPREFIDEVRRARQESAPETAEPLPDSNTLPPAFALEDDLSTYPGIP